MHNFGPNSFKIYFRAISVQYIPIDLKLIFNKTLKSGRRYIDLAIKRNLEGVQWTVCHLIFIILKVAYF